MRHAVHPCRALTDRVAPFVLAALLLLGGCGTGTPPQAKQSTIDPDTFIATYVDLRLAVLRAEPGEMNDSIRAAILARHDVTQEQLEQFAKVHGSNVAYMRSIWGRVETILQNTRPNGPTGSAAEPPDGPPSSARQPGGQGHPDGQRLPSTH